MIYVFDREEKNCGRRKGWLPAFSPFSAMFSKVFLIKVMKTRACVVKGYDWICFCKGRKHHGRREGNPFLAIFLIG